MSDFPTPPYQSPPVKKVVGAGGVSALMLTDPWTRWINNLATYVSGISAGTSGVTHTGPLVKNALVVGNGGSDISSNPSIGVPGQVLTSAGPGLPPVFVTGGSAAGVNGSIQFNTAGVLNGSSAFRYDQATNTLIVPFIDGAVIGSVTPAAGSFTSLDASTLGFVSNASLILAQRAFYRPIPAAAAVASAPAPVVVDDASLTLAQRAFYRPSAVSSSAAAAPATVTVDDSSLVIAQKAMTRPAPPPPIVTADSQQILPTQIFGA